MNQRVVCVEPEVAVDFAEFRPLLEKVLDLIRRSIQIHGDWSDYDEDRVFDAVAGEFDEYREAVVVRDVSGRHGQIDELFDMAVTSIKGIRRLSALKQGVGGVPPKPFTAQGVRIGDYKIRRLRGGKLWMENAEGEGGVFQEDGLRAAIDSFWAGSF